MEGKLSCLVRTHRAHFLREGYLTFHLVDRLKTSFFPLCLACARDSDSSYLVFGFEFHSYVPSTTVLVSLGVITKHLHVSFRSAPPLPTGQLRTAKKPGCYKVKISPGKFIEFVQDEREQYSFPFPHSWTHSKFPSPAIADDRHNQEVLVAVSVYNSEFPSHFTNAELDRARRAGVLHRSLHHPCDAYLSTILDEHRRYQQRPTQLPPDQRSLQGVSYRQITSTKFSESVFSNLSSLKSTYDGHLFLLRSSRKEGAISYLRESRTGHIVTARLPAKTTNQLSTTIQDVVNFYKSKGHTVKLIRTDREANLLACEDFLLSDFPCSAPARGVMSSKLRD